MSSKVHNLKMKYLSEQGRIKLKNPLDLSDRNRLTQIEGALEALEKLK